MVLQPVESLREVHSCLNTHLTRYNEEFGNVQLEIMLSDNIIGHVIRMHRILSFSHGWVHEVVNGISWMYVFLQWHIVTNNFYIRHYCIETVKSLQLIWSSCRFYLLNLQMSWSDCDTSKMRGYQDSSPNNVHQGTCPYIDGLVQDCSISIAIPLEILQSCTKPSIWGCVSWQW